MVPSVTPIQAEEGEKRGTAMRTPWKLARPLMLVVALAVLCVVPQQAAAEDEDDPPSRVARLSYLRGSVSFQPAGEEEWVSAVVNRPMTTGDKLWADQGARAELQIGSATLRLSDDTGFSFLDLSDRVTQIRLTAGTLYVRLRELDADETFEVDTPNLAFSLLRAGEYRIDVNDAGDVTRVTVRVGQGEVTGGGQAFAVRVGQTAEFRGTDQLETAYDTMASRDDFDQWCAERNAREDRARSAEYVSRDVIGYEDLDDYGEWRAEPEYGHVWFPRTVVVDWAPYRYGHWAWIWPWGWTWVDDAPWGFAPFHYGRWVFVGGYWGWVPCPARVRPVYAPALVAWIGGPSFSIGISVGRGPAVGWFPLGPREVYIPWYRVSPRYVTHVNVTNTTVTNIQVTNVYNTYVTNRVTNIRYVNRERVTVTSRTVFTSAQPVGRNIVRVDRREIERARVGPEVNIAPQQRAVLGAGNPSTRRPPERVVTREVVAKTAPPPRPVPFAVQRKAIEASGGRVPDRKEIERVRPKAEEGPRRNVRMAPPVRAGQGEAPVRPRPQPPVVERPEAGKPQPAAPERPVPRREDRPPAVQREERAAPQPAERPAPKLREERPEGQPAERPRAMPAERPDRPPKTQRQVEREEQLQRKQEQEQQELRQKQERDRQRLEQKHREQEGRARQQAENARQQQEHARQQQRQEQERRQLDQRQQQQRQKVERQEAKQRQKEGKKQKPEKAQDQHPPRR